MFSIIIPSYNRFFDLSKLLDDLCNQTYKNFEVVIIDDCSSEEYFFEKEYFFDIKLIRNSMNRGVAISRNIGVSISKYDWVLFLDDDDKFNHRKCEILYRAIHSNKNINFIYHSAKCHMVNQGFSYITKPEKDTKKITFQSMICNNKIGGAPMFAIRKDVFDKVGGFSEKMRALEDYDFLLRLIDSGYANMEYIDIPLTECFFYTKRTSVSKNLENTIKAMDTIKENYNNNRFLDKNCFDIILNDNMAYASIMMLSRNSCRYYWRNFLITKKFLYLMKFLIALISPNILIKLRKYK